MKVLFFGIILCINASISGQYVDSLWNVVSNEDAVQDSTYINAIQRLMVQIKYLDPDTTIYLGDKAIAIAKKIGADNQIPLSIELQADAYWQLSKLSESLEAYRKAKELYVKQEDWLKEGYMYSNMGYLYMDLNQYEDALTNYQKALTIADELEHDELRIVTLSYLASIYEAMSNFDKSIAYYRQALAFYKERGNQKNVQICLNNIGNIYYGTKKLDSALYFYKSSVAIGREIDDEKNTSTGLLNVSSIYIEQGNYTEAEPILKEVIILNKNRNDRVQLFQNYINLSNLYFYQNRLKEMFIYLSKAKEIADNSENLEYKSTVLLNLADYYGKKNNYKKAFDYFKEHINLKDSMIGLETSKQINELAAAYESERKELEISNLEKDKELKEALLAKSESSLKEADIERKQSELYRIGLIIGVVLLLIIIGSVFLGYKSKSKANLLISLQMDLVEEKNKEIMDSINYAKRIQNAILPQVKVVKEYLRESFILYKPKDIVAGDFYWLETIQFDNLSISQLTNEQKEELGESLPSNITQGENIVLFAAADCTGHGVPGAMVSVVCNNGLNRSVREYGLTDPGEILDKTREIVIQEFEKSEEDVKDGMDIALCALRVTRSPTFQESQITAEKSGQMHSKATLQYAGAHNPLWIIRYNASEVEEIKADKEPIGKFDKQTPYTTHEVDLFEGDSIYIFSDGYIDQFGGEKGKKFKARAFRELLLSIQNKSMEEQKIEIDNAFEYWRGDLEQIDDVCIIGVRV